MHRHWGDALCTLQGCVTNMNTETALIPPARNCPFATLSLGRLLCLVFAVTAQAKRTTTERVALHCASATMTRTLHSSASQLSSRAHVAQRSCLNRRHARVCARSNRLNVQAVRHEPCCVQLLYDARHHREEFRDSSLLLQVIPMLSGDATEQTPPDLPSYLFKERIVYLVRSAALPLHSAGSSINKRFEAAPVAWERSASTCAALLSTTLWWQLQHTLP